MSYQEQTPLTEDWLPNPEQSDIHMHVFRHTCSPPASHLISSLSSDCCHPSTCSNVIRAALFPSQTGLDPWFPSQQIIKNALVDSRCLWLYFNINISVKINHFIFAALPAVLFIYLFFCFRKHFQTLSILH